MIRLFELHEALVHMFKSNVEKKKEFEVNSMHYITLHHEWVSGDVFCEQDFSCKNFDYMVFSLTLSLPLCVGLYPGRLLKCYSTSCCWYKSDSIIESMNKTFIAPNIDMKCYFEILCDGFFYSWRSLAKRTNNWFKRVFLFHFVSTVHNLFVFRVYWCC